MPRRILYLLTALLAGAFIPAQAASISCALQMGSPAANGPIITPACDQALASPITSLDWGNVISANSAINTSGTLSTVTEGDSITLTSSDNFEGLENTDLTWNGSAWVPVWAVNSATATYGGQFNSTTEAGGPPPEGVFGDDLLGVIQPQGISNANTTMTMAFTQTVSYIGFQVSDAGGVANSSFTAELIAYDSGNNVIGTYTVTDMGGGGLCPGLNNSDGPQPCNDAPLLQFYDPEDGIASVELIMSDAQGALLDTLELSPIPEPSSFALFGVGILGLLLAAKRGYFRRWSSLTARD